MTDEFGDDLDRLRKSNDFNEKSLPLLIETLKQGASLYTEEEKQKVMTGAGLLAQEEQEERAVPDRK